MDIQRIQLEAKANFLRYKQGTTAGHYESYFIRANHPTEPRAFWIRYTIFSPKNHPEKAIGEIWFIYFDKSLTQPVSSKSEFPIGECVFYPSHFNMQIGNGNFIQQNQAIGQSKAIKWNLNFKSSENALFLLPLHLYQLPFPKAKSIVSQPFSIFNGIIKTENLNIEIDNWIGSQNHNWGQKHTDAYAWGQVCGFDNAPDSFLEVISAQLKVAFVKTPILTILVFRHKGKEYRINEIKYWFRSKARYKYFDWNFTCENEEIKIKGRIFGDAEDFIGLNYYNPPGGNKYCLNSKIVSCELQIDFKGKNIQTEYIHTESRAAFEILTDDKTSHGVEIVH
jgi:hypothetical protein